MLWNILLIISTLLILSCTAEDGEPVTLMGEIRLDPPLTEVPENSCLTVKFTDQSRMDHPEILIAKKVTHNLDSEFNWLDYKLNVPKQKLSEYEEFHTLAVSATLNLGWCPQDENEEWFRKGDYTSDTTHPVELAKCNDRVCDGPNVLLVKP